MKQDFMIKQLKTSNHNILQKYLEKIRKNLLQMTENHKNCHNYNKKINKTSDTFKEHISAKTSPKYEISIRKNLIKTLYFN